ncbi:MAG: phosphoglucomutase/phosphomannomutase family protein [Caldiserica bacterium]|nr:phosphoglucomutase/phosphomannomutase family protein [Caldisericota bacterium]
MAQTIRFGTDGWRGVIARDFTFDNVARVAAATARYLADPARRDLPFYRDWGVPYRGPEAGVVVGYDTRFLSREFAETVARVLAAEGIPAALTDAPVPTPALSYIVVARRLAGAVMLTASHNPPRYNGFKFKPEYGGSATKDATDLIERHLPPRPPDVPEDAVVTTSIREEYLSALEGRVDLNAIGAAPVHVVVDPMYGSAQGYLAELLRAHGIPFTAIRSRIDPLFGGKKPEPLPEFMGPTRAVIRSLRGRVRRRILVGLITDGDGDRAASMDEDGNFLDTHRTSSLILWHLIRNRGERGLVLKSFALTDLIRKIAEDAGLEVREIKIGFKWAVEGLVKREAIFGGEESGGYGYRWHLPERDGMLAGLLLLELIAAEGKGLGKLLAELFRRYGPHYYDRVDMELPERAEVVERIMAAPPESVAGRKVVAVETLDGVKLRFGNGWLLFRASGTEPILRVYCEMESPKAVEEVISAGTALAKEVAHG